MELITQSFVSCTTCNVKKDTPHRPTTEEQRRKVHAEQQVEVWYGMDGGAEAVQLEVSKATRYYARQRILTVVRWFPIDIVFLRLYADF